MSVTVENKLKALYNLQKIDSEIDRLNLLKGELPLEVSDLEDEIAGLETRIENILHDISEFENNIVGFKGKIKDNEQLIVKYKKQLNDVKNNREFEALSKESEILGLEIEQAQKRIREQETSISMKKEMLDRVKEEQSGKQSDLKFKKEELKEIVKETEAEENNLTNDRNGAAKTIETRLLSAYERIRSNVKNGIAVAEILRGSCGGCFAKIPPQRQSDIKAHLKVIDCEHCGRILVDNVITGKKTEIIEVVEEKPKRKRTIGGEGLKKRLGAK